MLCHNLVYISYLNCIYIHCAYVYPSVCVSLPICILWEGFYHSLGPISWIFSPVIQLLIFMYSVCINHILIHFIRLPILCCKSALHFFFYVRFLAWNHDISSSCYIYVHLLNNYCCWYRSPLNSVKIYVAFLWIFSISSLHFLKCSDYRWYCVVCWEWRGVAECCVFYDVCKLMGNWRQMLVKVKWWYLKEGKYRFCKTLLSERRNFTKLCYRYGRRKTGWGEISQVFKSYLGWVCWYERRNKGDRYWMEESLCLQIEQWRKD